MKRSGIGFAVVLLVAVGCSGEDSGTPAASSVAPTDLPTCEEVYAEGAEIVERDFGLACIRGEELLSPRPVRLECSDGRILLFNDLAWGYEGETMTVTPEDDPSKMPEAAVDDCMAATPGGTQPDADS